MAIIEKTFYAVVCDGCGQELEEDYYDNEKWTEELAEDAGWLVIRGKHYCEDCHHYGDNNELILGDGTVISEDEPDWK